MVIGVDKIVLSAVLVTIASLMTVAGLYAAGVIKDPSQRPSNVIMTTLTTIAKSASAVTSPSRKG